MKLAYIILAHKNSAQVIRLINALNHEDTSFVIHVSKTAEKGFNKELKRSLKNKPNLWFCKRENSSHYFFGVVKGTLNALKLLIKKAPDFEYVNFLTGQDYPIKSSKFINEFFNQNNGREFIRYWPMFPEEDSDFFKNHPWGEFRQMYRIDRYHFKWFNKNYAIPELLSRRLIDHSLWQTIKIFLYESPLYIKEKRWRDELILMVLSRILPEKRKIPTQFTSYGGKTWWSLTKPCADFIINFSKKNIKFNRYCKHTLLPDEMYFQTILLNSPFKDKIENDYLREIEWEGGDGTHPIIFTKKDIERLKNSKNLFARKFDLDIDSDIFDLIDNEILNK